MGKKRRQKKTRGTKNSMFWDVGKGESRMDAFFRQADPVTRRDQERLVAQGWKPIDAAKEAWLTCRAGDGYTQDVLFETKPSGWVPWNSSYRKERMQARLITGEQVEVWPNAGRLVALDGSGREWTTADREVEAVRSYPWGVGGSA